MLKIAGADPIALHAVFVQHVGLAFQIKGQTLACEKLELTQTKRGNSWAWVKIPGHERNEALDCRNYALGGFRIINPDMEAVERRLKSLPEQPRPKRAAAPQQRRTNAAAQLAVGLAPREMAVFRAGFLHPHV